jgi:NAD(P)-dependent dehydrogenase (short-subunit alcohol dehydrogenase family)
VGRVDGKVAIVTGAASGIGRAAALGLALEGARVALADVDDVGGSDASEEIQRAGGVALFQRTDVGSTDDVRELVQAAVGRFGRLDILVNNAGVAIGGSVTNISEDDWNRVLNVNLTSMWRGMRFAIPEMRKAGGGSIVNTSSVQGSVGRHPGDDHDADERADRARVAERRRDRGRLARDAPRQAARTAGGGRERHRLAGLGRGLVRDGGMPPRRRRHDRQVLTTVGEASTDGPLRFR